MAFIPVDAKADIQGSKKGKMTPTQHAQLNAWCLASKTGILACLDKCEATLKTYVATNNIATIVLKRGYIVICGRLIECEEGTIVNVQTPTSGNVNGKIIIRCNLASSKDKEFEVTTTTSHLVQQDLNENPQTGVYEFELYSYTANANAVVLEDRIQPYVPDIGGKLAQFEASLKDEGKPLHGYDNAKGTIEERLTALGFKEGSVTLSRGTATVNKVTRQGNYCILDLKINNVNVPRENSVEIGTTSFLPKTEVSCYCELVWRYTNELSTEYGRGLVSIDEQGNITLSHNYNTAYINNFSKVNLSAFGYEAKEN